MDFAETFGEVSDRRRGASARRRRPRSRLSATQLDVLGLACAGRSVSVGCCTMSCHGGRRATLLSLRRLGLLDALESPTDRGRAVHAAGGAMIDAK